jgi:hypothetical protein
MPFDEKVWNPATLDTKPTAELDIPTTGVVRHIEIVANNVMYSVDEPIEEVEIKVGKVYLQNLDGSPPIEVKVSCTIIIILFIFIFYYIN